MKQIQRSPPDKSRQTEHPTCSKKIKERPSGRGWVSLHDILTYEEEECDDQQDGGGDGQHGAQLGPQEGECRWIGRGALCEKQVLKVHVKDCFVFRISDNRSLDIRNW